MGLQPLEQLPPRTSVTKENCHPGQLPPGQLPPKTNATIFPF